MGDFQATFAQASECQPPCNLLSALCHGAFISAMASSITATIRTHSLSSGERPSTAIQKKLPIEGASATALAKKIGNMVVDRETPKEKYGEGTAIIL